MMNKIPQKRLLIYLILFALIPILFSALFVFSRVSYLTQADEDLNNFKDQVVLKDKKQATNNKVRAFFKNADHFYIDKHLETLSFLEPEIEALQKIVSQKNFPDDESIKKRLDFLSGSGNDIVFTEGVVQSYGPIQETLETETHPIEINVQDLHRILSRIEGVDFEEEKSAPNRPQLIILDFKLDKKTNADKNDVYQLNMKLLKREFS